MLKTKLESEISLGGSPEYREVAPGDEGTWG